MSRNISTRAPKRSLVRDAGTIRTDAAPLLTTADCAATIAALERGELDWHAIDAHVESTFAGGRVWRSPEWKAMRAARIGSECAQCTETDGPMILQHLRHPRSVGAQYATLRKQHRENAFEAFVADHPLDDHSTVAVPTGAPRHGCPKCGGWNISERKKLLPRYICRSTRNRRSCLHTFDQPVSVTPTRSEDAYERTHKAFLAMYVALPNAPDDATGRALARNTLAELSEYLTGETALTFCRRCAFLWDKIGVRLCVQCRSAWHPIVYAQCAECLGADEFVTCTRCQRYRHPSRFLLCYRCAMAAKGDHNMDPLAASAAYGDVTVLTDANPSLIKATTIPPFPIGSRVRHRLFGVGTLVAAASLWPIVRVAFDDPAIGPKTLATRLARLELVTNESTS